MGIKFLYLSNENNINPCLTVLLWDGHSTHSVNVSLKTWALYTHTLGNTNKNQAIVFPPRFCFFNVYFYIVITIKLK